LATRGSSWEREDDDACGWGVGRSRRIAWGHGQRGREAMAGAPVPLSSTARTSASTRRIGGGAFGSGPELGGFTVHTRSSRFAFFFKRDGESAVEPRCRFPASAANNFLENDGSVLPPATSILPPVCHSTNCF